MADDSTSYEISKLAYVEPHKRGHVGEYEYDAGSSSKHTAVYRHKQHGTVILGHRGTVPTDVEGIFSSKIGK